MVKYGISTEKSREDIAILFLSLFLRVCVDVTLNYSLLSLPLS